jgi:hypothetical protein
MKTQPFTADSNENLANEISAFLNKIEIVKHEKYDIIYTIRKELVTLSCYTYNGKHCAILCYDEKIKL